MSYGIELRGRTALDQDWQTLLYCGRNGIGHLDVFRSDAAAERYYLEPRRETSDQSILPAIARFIEGKATNAEVEQVLNGLGPTAGIPGVQPKVLFGEWLIKLENPAYPGLLELENLAYETHRQAGFTTPETMFLNLDGKRYLASRRFD